MSKRSRKLVLTLAVVAGAVAALLVAAEVNGTSPQQFLAGAVGGSKGNVAVTHPSLCCGAELPCYEGSAQNSTPNYWCGCYWGKAQGSSTQQPVPCGFDCAYSCCYYCPPPCTGICPMRAPAIPAG